MAKKFFYVCAGILCLMVAYHLGGRTAQAQVGSAPSGFSVTTNHTIYALTPNGEVFMRRTDGNGNFTGTRVSMGNIWAFAPTPTEATSFGELKARYRGDLDEDQ
jgi:hypothetical protein